MTTHSRFAADTRKLAYAQAFTRTSTPHPSTGAERVVFEPTVIGHAHLRALSSLLHRSRRSPR